MHLCNVFQFFLYEATNRSCTFGSVKIRWFFDDSSMPFGYADRVTVVSCSLIGVLDLMSLAIMERRMTLRCSRRESPKYFLELTSEKLCPRRELRSDDRRSRLRILFVAQHNRYLTITKFGHDELMKDALIWERNLVTIRKKKDSY